MTTSFNLHFINFIETVLMIYQYFHALGSINLEFRWALIKVLSKLSIS
jgi:hypothetical protein